VASTPRPEVSAPPPPTNPPSQPSASPEQTAAIFWPDAAADLTDYVLFANAKSGFGPTAMTALWTPCLPLRIAETREAYAAGRAPVG